MGDRLPSTRHSDAEVRRARPIQIEVSRLISLKLGDRPMFNLKTKLILAIVSMPGTFIAVFKPNRHRYLFSGVAVPTAWCSISSRVAATIVINDWCVPFELLRFFDELPIVETSSNTFTDK